MTEVGTIALVLVFDASLIYVVISGVLTTPILVATMVIQCAFAVAIESPTPVDRDPVVRVDTEVVPAVD